MAQYVDGYLIPVPKRNLKAYARMAAAGGKVWKKYGALHYMETVGDDLAPKGVTPFTRYVKLRAGETLVFSFIVYRSRAHRDRVNAAVMKDPSMKMPPKGMPFDFKRMAFGGFRAIVAR